ncbi:MAG: HU family DNA-binding protein [Rikenellaceae bacterium]|nr:HU family DNA-binding protein [Rikenellaceae bacterium]
MNKSQIIDALAEDVNIKKKEAKEIVDSLIKITTQALKKGDYIAVTGLGTLYIAERKEKLGRNPKTGEPLKIKAKKIVKFRAGRNLGGNGGTL